MIAILPSVLLVTAAALGQATDTADQPADLEQLIAILTTEKRDLSHLANRRHVDNSPATKAASRLIQLRGEAVPAVAALLEHERPTVRANAVWILGSMRFAEAEAQLLSALDDPEVQVRRAAVAGLRTIANLQIRKALWQMLKDNDAEVRTAAVRQLAFPLDKPPSRDEIDNYQRNTLIDALKPLLRDDSLKVRQAVATTLSSYCNPSAIEPLKVLLTDDDAYVRGEAAEGLGRTGSRRAVEPLLAALDDQPWVAGRAAFSLGELGDPRATTRLLAKLQSSEPTLIRVSAEALGKIGDRRAVTPLLPLLEHEQEMVRRAAAEALGRLQDERAVQSLIDTLDPTKREASQIVEALAQLNDERAIIPIADALFAQPESAANVTDAVERAAPKIKHPAMVRELAERSIAQPEHQSAFIARRIVGRLTDQHFDFDSEGFARWWERSKAQFAD